MKYKLRTFFRSKLNTTVVSMSGAFILFALLSKLHFIFSYLAFAILGVDLILIGVIVQKQHKKEKIKLTEVLQKELNPKKRRYIKLKQLLPLKLGFILLYAIGIIAIYHVFTLILR